LFDRLFRETHLSQEDSEAGVALEILKEWLRLDPVTLGHAKSVRESGFMSYED